MMFRVPGLTVPHQVCDRVVSLMDVYPTLAQLAGLPEPSGVDGRSLVPLLKDSKAPWNVPALSAYQGNMSVRTDGYRLIRYKDGTTEFYDETKDPHEWTNQTRNPEYTAMQAQMAAMLPDQTAMAPSVDDIKGEKKSKGKKQPAREE
jgi:arylsulfatase A-like enzyme